MPFQSIYHRHEPLVRNRAVRLAAEIEAAVGRLDARSVQGGAAREVRMTLRLLDRVLREHEQTVRLYWGDVPADSAPAAESETRAAARAPLRGLHTTRREPPVRKTVPGAGFASRGRRAFCRRRRGTANPETRGHARAPRRSAGPDRQNRQFPRGV